MSKPAFVLYRAVTTKPVQIFEFEDGERIESILPAGSPIGRRSGYLSRSSAVSAAHRLLWDSDEFEVIRSEPVVFLSRAEQLQKQINALSAELETVRARS